MEKIDIDSSIYSVGLAGKPGMYLGDTVVFDQNLATGAMIPKGFLLTPKETGF
jgi:hypothetical protein